MHHVALPLLALAATAWTLACASAPPPPASGTAQVWGVVDLVPREGVPIAAPGASSYGDRRLREVKRVDYSDPGFAVVYLARTTPQPADASVRIVEGPAGIGFESQQGVVGVGSTLRIRNDAARALILSAPTLDVVFPLEAGEERMIPIARGGEHTLFLPGVSRDRATLFAAPGRFDRITSSGRYALTDVPPGAHELRVWHSRLPPRSQPITLAPDASLRLDLSVGVSAGPSDPGEHETEPGEGHAHAH
jgi:hypothetical protein